VTCPDCGRWAPADRATGYDADDLCPDCAEGCADGDRWGHAHDGPVPSPAMIRALRRRLLDAIAGGAVDRAYWLTIVLWRWADRARWVGQAA